MTQAKHRVLDKADVAILACLHRDARMANKAVAEEVGLAPSSCLERIKRLQSEGVITGSRLLLAAEKLGGVIQAMVAVRLSAHDRSTVAGFQQELVGEREVVCVYHMGGDNDFLVHVTVPNAQHLRDFVFDRITARPEVVHVETTLIYDYVTSDTLATY